MVVTGCAPQPLSYIYLIGDKPLTCNVFRGSLEQHYLTFNENNIIYVVVI